MKDALEEESLRWEAEAWKASVCFSGEKLEFQAIQLEKLKVDLNKKLRNMKYLTTWASGNWD